MPPTPLPHSATPESLAIALHSIASIGTKITELCSHSKSLHLSLMEHYPHLAKSSDGLSAQVAIGSTLYRIKPVYDEPSRPARNDSKPRQPKLIDVTVTFEQITIIGAQS